MIRIPFAVAVSLAAAMLFGCAQQQPHAEPATTLTCDDGTAFLDHVFVLQASPNYHPNPGDKTYKAPSPQPPPPPPWPASSVIAADLQSAFDHAPHFFRTQLCGLNAIYIDAQACNNDPSNCTLTNAGGMFGGSWGYRSRDSSDKGNTYIGISAADLWNKGTSARTLDDYETQLMASLPGVRTGSYVDSQKTSPDDPWMSVLAALAHEMGHVLWAETTIATPGASYGSHDFDKLIDCNFFLGWNYKKIDELRPKGRWRHFYDPANSKKHDRANEANNTNLDHSNSPYLYAPPGPPDLDDSDPSIANKALGDLLQSGQPWASLFGAQTPDEDFVETYVMAVLTGYGNGTFTGPLKNLPVYIPSYGSSPDVPGDLIAGNKKDLKNKIACLLP